MACLRLSLQPLKGPDIMLQTHEWFPPARALVVVSSFKAICLAFASGKSTTADDGDQSLGDDPLAASSGQVIVGKERKYQIVYRLVNNIYVLGIATADHVDTTNNIVKCSGIVNQAVNVVVAACRGVDVTPDKLHRKYTNIYMALDIVLCGASSIRLATILAPMHGEGIAKMVLSAIDADNRVRGAERWNQLEGQSLEHQPNVQVLSQALFELPEETLSVGDEVAATLIPTPQSSATQTSQQKSAEKPTNEDPFVVNGAINKTDELAESTFIGVEGFEGDYGGIELSNEQTSLAEAFEGLDDAFGGGLDPSEFGATIEPASTKGRGGLELLVSGQTT
ncbi:hypothetical protein SUGI_0180500 [Cryptomeria japonica]|nr:hypothetical protein SUGI_0180500 [Cryptomeria japonica]